MTRTWETNADEFAALDEGEGWPFARLVACSVQRGNGQGARQPRRDHDEVAKISARRFAERAHTATDRVLRYLDAWERAAEREWVMSADLLMPDMAHTLTDPEHSFSEVYDARKAGGRPRDSKPADAVTIMERRGVMAVVSAMPVDLQRDVLAALQTLLAERNASLESPIRLDDARLRTGSLMLDMVKVHTRLVSVVKRIRDGEIDRVDADDRQRLHLLATRVRAVIDLIDMAADSIVNDAALEAWLSEESAS